MMRLRAFLTDLDGTLIHSHDCICDALARSFAHIGITPPPKENILGMFGLPVEVMLTTLSEVAEEDEQRIQSFLSEYKRQYPICMENAQVIDGAYETLRAVYKADYPVCLITNERSQNAQFILKATGLSPYITTIISRDDVARFKPDPEPILKGAQACGVLPNECLYLGESPFDMQAGIAAQVYTVGVPSGLWSKKSLVDCSPTQMIDDIREVQTILNIGGEKS